MSARFERRFAGRDNAGLRKKIRDVVSRHQTGEERRRAVLSLAGLVALTAAGRATLALVAEDYAHSVRS